jgi:WD40 repeat protein
LTISKDERKLAFGGNDKKVWIISIDQKNQSSLGKLLENTISLKDNVNACEFNPDGTKLLVSTAKEVRLYPAISGNEPLNDF